MKSKKKSFFFEDYKESEIIYNKKSFNSPKISLNRISFLFFIFFSLMTIFSIKLIYLSLFTEKNIFSQKNKQSFVNTRADIVDRNGVILARNTNVYTAGIRPKFIKNKEKFLINLRLKFPELNVNEIEQKLKKGKFFYIGNKRLTERDKDNLWELGLSSKVLEIQKKQYRIYPQKNLFSHVLGQTDEDNKGISGIEKFYNNELGDNTKIHIPLSLTLDSNLQYLIREELINSQSDFNYIGSAAILMNVENGEIL